MVSTSAIIVLLVIASTLLFSVSEYFDTQQVTPKECWDYYVHRNHLSEGSSGALIKMKHIAEGKLFPLTLTIEKHNGDKNDQEISDLSHTEITKLLNTPKSSIKHAILKSEHPLEFPEQTKARLLQGLTVEDPFVLFSLSVFKVILSLTRNFVLIGLVTNSMDILMPFIIFTESFTMLAFWTNEKHCLTAFFKDIFSSKYDLINAVRLGMTEPTERNSMSILQLYGYENNLISNISGELLFTFLFLAATLLIKVLNVFMKVERLRLMNSKLRALWNGYVFAIAPRLAVFVGFEIRSILMATASVASVFLALLIITGLIFYFIQIVVQVRRINSRLEYINESRLEIGLAERLNYQKDFEFDCLQYSMLHYCGMNYLRLLLFFLPIGIAYDTHYISYGGVIASQLIFVMFNISCSGFKKTTDKVVYPFVDFLFIIIALALISVGLAQSVRHSEVSIVAEKVLFSFFLASFSLYIGLLVHDLVDTFEGQCTDGDKEQELKKEEKNFITNIGRKKQQKKPRKNVKIKEAEQILSSVSSSESEQYSSVTIKKKFILPSNNVRKVRKGKII